MEYLFQTECDYRHKRLSVKAGHSITFKLRALTPSEHAAYQDKVQSNMRAKGKEIMFKAGKVAEANREAVKHGVMGWDGLEEKEGTPIPFNDENLKRFLKAPKNHIAELAEVILNLTNDGDPEGYDDDDPLPLAGETS